MSGKSKPVYYSDTELHLLETSTSTGNHSEFVKERIREYQSEKERTDVIREIKNMFDDLLDYIDVRLSMVKGQDIVNSLEEKKENDSIAVDFDF